MFWRSEQKKRAQADAATALIEMRRLHDTFIDEFRASMEHLKRSADASLKKIADANKLNDELADVMARRAEQINSLASDIDRIEARIAKIEGEPCSLRAAILINGLPPPTAG